MNDNGRSLFDRLDSIESKQEELLKNINNLNNNQYNNQGNKQQLSDKEVLNIFIKKAQKDYLWFGPNEEFLKSKRAAIVSCIFLILIGIISTIFTTIAFKMYSTFSLFENIVVIEAFFILHNLLCTKKIMNDKELKDCHCDIFEQNIDNAWCSTGKEKKRYKWFRILSYIAIICNIIVVWTQSGGGIAVVATIFEVMFFAIIIFSHFKNIELFCMYNNIIIITGRNFANTETIRLVFDVISRKLVPFNEFEEKFKFIFEE